MMNETDQLYHDLQDAYDAYEEAKMRLLMNRYAEIQGQKLMEENERLENDPSFSIPAGFDAHLSQTFKHLAARENRKRFSVKLRYVATKVAVFVLCLCTLFTVSFVSVSAFREKICSVVIRDQGIATQIGVVTLSDEFRQINIPGGLNLPKAVPAEYMLTQLDIKNNTVFAIYTTADQRQISFLSRSGHGLTNIDTEDAVSTDSILICGYSGIVTQKNGKTNLAWFDTALMRVFEVVVDGNDSELALEIASSLYKN